MERLKWVIVLLALVDAGYMVVDGTRALVAGDYFTPSSGEHAGELGPWARIVETIGVDPRSTGMKAFFVVYGLAWLGVVAMFALERSWAWGAMLVLAAASAWYLTVGTIVSVAVVALLLVPAVRDLY
ncbi:MAG TPA: hypothetical protein VHI71_08080 [Actinomycetota bacterium]|nr:hypothetical protein [Actinomycetota bacterium]